MKKILDKNEHKGVSTRKFEEMTDISDAVTDLTIEEDENISSVDDEIHEEQRFEEVAQKGQAMHMNVDNHKEKANSLIKDDVIDNNDIDLELLSHEIDSMNEVKISDIPRDIEGNAGGNGGKRTVEIEEKNVERLLKSDKPVSIDEQIEDMLKQDKSMQYLGDDDVILADEKKHERTDPDETDEVLFDDLLDDDFVIIEKNFDLSPVEKGEDLVLEDATISRDESQKNEYTSEEKNIPENRSDTLVIEIPESLKESLGGEFTPRKIKPIDLKEAERIANEDILFLTEDDLVEELQGIDLKPLTNPEVKAQKSDVVIENKESIEKKAVQSLEIADTIDETAYEGLASPKKEEKETIRELEEYEKLVQDEFTEIKDAPKDLRITSIEDVASSHLKAGDADKGTQEVSTSMADEKNDISPPLIKEEEIPVVAKDTEEKVVSSKTNDRMDSFPTPTGEVAMIGNQAGNVEGGEFQDVVKSEPEIMMVPETEKTKIEEYRAEYPDSPIETSEVIESKDQEREVTLPVEPLEREVLPSSMIIQAGDHNVHLIDDDRVEKEIRSDESIFEQTELDKITSSVVEVVEGDVRILPEASVEEDMEKVASVMSGTALAFEDLLIDLEGEYKFTDEEIGFVDDSFMKDLSNLMETAVLKHEDEATKTVTHAVEILGMTLDEVEIIDRDVFKREYERIDIEKIHPAMGIGQDQHQDDFQVVQDYTYFLPRKDSLSEEEKASIAKDVSGEGAVVFEEDTDEIEKKLHELTNRRPKIASGNIHDISDKIVIIEDERDIERFVEEVPREKRKNIKKLLNYLDGLFEKLPEDVIARFAESEYYNLYVQILDDLDK